VHFGAAVLATTLSRRPFGELFWRAELVSNTPSLYCPKTISKLPDKWMVTSKLFKSMRIWEVILAQLEKYFQYIHLQLLTALQCFLSFMFPTCLRNINQADERKCQNSSAPNRQHQTTVAKTANSPYSVLGKRSCDDNFLQIFCPVFLATITKAHFWLGISYST